MKTAIVVGATGLVGKEIVNKLLQDENWEKVVIFSRHSTGIQNEKLEEHLVDFNNLEQWKHQLTGDTLFSALGTTKEKAGSISAQRKVDYSYQYELAKAARVHGVESLVLVSAPFAHPRSPIPYTKMKGELERDVIKLGFVKLTIVRPGPLEGHREESRPNEEKATHFLKKLPKFPGFEVLRPVPGQQVAKACVKAALRESLGVEILNPKEVLNA